MKKIFLILLMVGIAAVLLSSCGSEKKTDISQQVELVWYTFGDNTAPTDLPKVEAKINEYLKQKINATVKIKVLSFSDYSDKMNTMLTSGEPADLVFTCSWVFDYRIYGPRGVLMPLDELVQKYGSDMKAIIPDYLWSVASVNGKLYGVPNYKDEVYQQAFLFNKNLLDKYSINVGTVKSYSDLEPIFAKIHAQDAGVLCLDTESMTASPFNKFDFVISECFPGAFRLDDPSGKIINQLEDQDYINFYKTTHQYFKNGYISKNAGLTNANQAEFKNGKVLCRVDVMLPGLAQIRSAEYGFPTIAVPAYAGSPVLSTSSCSGSMIGISATSQNPERAMMLLNLLNTDPYLRNLVQYGIENVHYKKISDQVINLLPESKNYQMAGFALGNQFIAYTTNQLPADYLAQLKKFNDSGVKSPGLGFAFDTEPVKNEISAISNIVAQQDKSILTGSWTITGV